MTAAMEHRGPDEEGFLTGDARAPGLALGMRRLSIIDLAGGHQPTWNETKDVAVIFNGELYNYRDLRERLSLCGHRLATQSDTEILVHAWEEWGEDSLSELRGMFAFALLDLRKRYATAPILFLARDPLGIKPRDSPSAGKQLRPLLEDAVRTHLIADVPVGLFLSSGLDSGAIAALAAQARGGIQSFTVTFPGTAFDEAALARLAANRFKTKHTEVPLSGESVLARLDEALSALDQPTMDAINTYFVSWAAREVGLKVALSGLGGDELFAGYQTFADTPRLSRLIGCAWYVPAAARRMTAPLVAGLA